MDHALQNAREALARTLAESATQTKLLEGVAATFGLKAPPQRIEVYDNSHIMGTNAVGGMIVAGPEGFRKSQYRKFNIKSADIVPGDDFGMMREVLRRRFSRLLKEAPREGAREGAADGVGEAAGGVVQGVEPAAPHVMPGLVEDIPAEPAVPTPVEASPSSAEPDAPPDSDPEEADALPDATEASPWPDLVLIDGGLGQLNAARTVLDELGITDVPLVGIAKGLDREAGREQFFLPGRTPFRMEPRDPVLYFIQRLRDEAHRFAIGSHRARRKKDITEAGLQAIAGVGPTRKRALLRHFGTLKAIERASLADLEQVAGINAATAKAVYDYFHERSPG